MSFRIYTHGSLASFVRRHETRTTWTQARSNTLGRANFNSNVSNWRERELGTFKKLVEHLITDYEHYVAKERPVIYRLGGANLWVASDAAQFSITLLEQIRAGNANNLHKF